MKNVHGSIWWFNNSWLWTPCLSTSLHVIWSQTKPPCLVCHGFYLAPSWLNQKLSQIQCLLPFNYKYDHHFPLNDEHGITQLKSQLMAQFCMINLDPMQKYLGIEFKCTTHGLLFHQTSYVWNFLNEFHMVDSTLACVPIHESICIQHDIGIEPINATLLSMDGR